MPPNQLWYCKIANTTLFTTILWSTLLIIVMTFERFYSIIMPHKAASFSTMNRAKITITCILTFGTIYNIPHIFVSANQGRNCVAHTSEAVIGQMYFWFSFVINFLFPFLSLMTMNGVIIHKIGNRSHLAPSRSEGQDKKSKMKNSEHQIYVTLLLVTFSFLVLMSPTFACLLYSSIVGIGDTPKTYADFVLFYNVAQKTYYTNFGINFFLYVISGQKFRSDLIQLFICNISRLDRRSTNTTAQ